MNTRVIKAIRVLLVTVLLLLTGAAAATPAHAWPWDGLCAEDPAAGPGPSRTSSWPGTSGGFLLTDLAPGTTALSAPGAVGAVASTGLTPPAEGPSTILEQYGTAGFTYTTANYETLGSECAGGVVRSTTNWVANQMLSVSIFTLTTALAIDAIIPADLPETIVDAVTTATVPGLADVSPVLSLFAVAGAVGAFVFIRRRQMSRLGQYVTVAVIGVALFASLPAMGSVMTQGLQFTRAIQSGIGTAFATSDTSGMTGGGWLGQCTLPEGAVNRVEREMACQLAGVTGYVPWAAGQFGSEAVANSALIGDVSVQIPTRDSGSTSLGVAQITASVIPYQVKHAGGSADEWEAQSLSTWAGVIDSVAAANAGAVWSGTQSTTRLTAATSSLGGVVVNGAIVWWKAGAVFYLVMAVFGLYAAALGGILTLLGRRGASWMMNGLEGAASGVIKAVLNAVTIGVLMFITRIVMTVQVNPLIQLLLIVAAVVGLWRLRKKLLNQANEFTDFGSGRRPADQVVSEKVSTGAREAWTRTKSAASVSSGKGSLARRASILAGGGGSTGTIAGTVLGNAARRRELASRSEQRATNNGEAAASDTTGTPAVTTPPASGAAPRTSSPPAGSPAASTAVVSPPQPDTSMLPAPSGERSRLWTPPEGGVRSPRTRDIAESSKPAATPPSVITPSPATTPSATTPAAPDATQRPGDSTATRQAPVVNDRRATPPGAQS